MKFLIVCAFAIVSISVNGAPQAGPILGLPIESYSESCRPRACPKTGETKLGFPLDCLSYVECVNGVATTRACPADMFWNEDAGNCTDRKTTKCNQCW